VGALIDYAFRKGSDWETGVGTLTDGSTLARTTVGASSNGGSLVNFSAGVGEIIETVTAATLAGMTSVRDVPFSQSVPLSRAGAAYMAPHAVSGPLTFTASANAVRGA